MENIDFKQYDDKPITRKELRVIFRKKLNDILYRPLTVKNISTFGEVALNNLIKLIDEVKREVSKIGTEYLGDLTSKEREEYYFKAIGLADVDIQMVLQLIIDKEEQIRRLKTQAENNIRKTKYVITPPGDNEKMLPGVNTFEKKKKIPRFLTLMYILETDFNIDVNNPNQIHKIEGIVSEDMMRRISYRRTTVPELHRAIYTCDEEGNVTYVFDTNKLNEIGLVNLTQLDNLTKKQKDNLIKKHPKVGQRIIQSPRWRERVSEALKNIVVVASNSADSKLMRSEFLRQKPIGDYHTFQQQAQAAYEAEQERRRQNGEAPIPSITK